MNARSDHLRIADRLGKVAAGSASADRVIHEALGLAWPVKAYAIEEEAAQPLLPKNFEWLTNTPTAGWNYAPCRRAGIGADGLAYPYHGQWGGRYGILSWGEIRADGGAAGEWGPED